MAEQPVRILDVACAPALALVGAALDTGDGGACAERPCTVVVGRPRWPTSGLKWSEACLVFHVFIIGAGPIVNHTVKNALERPSVG